MKLPAVFGALALAASLSAGDPPRVIEVRAKRFEFTPAEIHLKKGEPVLLRLTTEDVRHGLFSRPLRLDAEFEPGTPKDVPVTPGESGKFLVICDRFCGPGHGNMHLSVVVED
jgi:cytochrome c oxidase subunit 2